MWLLSVLNFRFFLTEVVRPYPLCFKISGRMWSQDDDDYYYYYCYYYYYYYYYAYYYYYYYYIQLNSVTCSKCSLLCVFVNLKNFYLVFLNKVGPKFLKIYNELQEIFLIKYYIFFKLMWAYICVHYCCDNKRLL